MGCKAYLKSNTSLRVTSLKHLDLHLDTRLFIPSQIVKILTQGKKYMELFNKYYLDNSLCIAIVVTISRKRKKKRIAMKD